MSAPPEAISCHISRSNALFVSNALARLSLSRARAVFRETLRNKGLDSPEVELQSPGSRLQKRPTIINRDLLSSKETY
jgi:hypothetical protein